MPINCIPESYSTSSVQSWKSNFPLPPQLWEDIRELMPDRETVPNAPFAKKGNALLKLVREPKTWKWLKYRFGKLDEHFPAASPSQVTQVLHPTLKAGNSSYILLPLPRLLRQAVITRFCSRPPSNRRMVHYSAILLGQSLVQFLCHAFESYLSSTYSTFTEVTSS